MRAFNPITQEYYEVPDALAAQYGLTESEAPTAVEPAADGGGGQHVVKNPITGDYYRVDPATYRSVFQPPEPTPLPETDPEDPEEGVRFSDFGNLVMSGGAGVAAGAGWMVRQLGARNLGLAIENLGNDAVDYWNDRLTPAMQKELAKEFIVEDEDGGLEWGDAGMTTVAALGAQSLLGTAAGMGVGAGLTRMLQVFGNPMGRATLVNIVDKAKETGNWSATAVQAARKLSVIDGVLGTVGFAAGEGSIGGMMTGASVEDQVRNLPRETLLKSERFQQILSSTEDGQTDPELREQYARETLARELSTEAGMRSGLTTGLLGAPMGAFFGKILGGHAVASTRVRAAFMGAAGEAGQEFGQSGTERIYENVALAEAGMDRDFWDGVLNAAVGGAAAGAVMGAGFGVSQTPEGQVKKAAADEAKALAAKQLQAVQDASDRATRAGVPAETVKQIIEENTPNGILVVRQRLNQAVDEALEAADFKPVGEPVGDAEGNVGPAEAAPTAPESEAPAAPEPVQSAAPAATEPVQSAAEPAAEPVLTPEPQVTESTGPAPEEPAGDRAQSTWTPTAKDPRTKRRAFQQGVDRMADELVPGGGISYTKDENGNITGRTPSQNPDWFQEMGQNPETRMPVAKVKQLVEKARKGEKLGVRQERVLGWMLDTITGEREESVDYAREQLEAARELRRQARGGAELTPETDPFDMAGEVFEENEYDDEMTGESRAIFELTEQATAAGVSEDTIESLAARFPEDGEYMAALNAEIERQTNVDEPSAGDEPLALQPQQGPQSEAPAAPAPDTQDIFGDDVRTRQQLADRERALDAERVAGQESVETGDPTDLFSQARQQQDIEDAPAKSAASQANAADAPLTGKQLREATEATNAKGEFDHDDRLTPTTEAAPEKPAAPPAAEVKVTDKGQDAYGTPLIELTGLFVPKEARGQGLATEAMEKLVAEADARGQRIVLNADSSYEEGAKRTKAGDKRLKRFYKRFGFVENKGRYKDFSLGGPTQFGVMYRNPDPAKKAPEAPAAEAQTVAEAIEAQDAANAIPADRIARDASPEEFIARLDEWADFLESKISDLEGIAPRKADDVQAVLERFERGEASIQKRSPIGQYLSYSGLVADNQYKGSATFAGLSARGADVLRAMRGEPARPDNKPFVKTENPPAAPAGNPKLAERLRTAADRMQKQIDNKLDPAVAHQNPTARRARMAAGSIAEGEYLQGVQQVLRGLADMAEEGTTPPELKNVTTKASIDALLRSEKWPANMRVFGTDLEDLLADAKGIRGKGTPLEGARRVLRPHGYVGEGRRFSAKSGVPEAIITVLNATKKAGREAKMRWKLADRARSAVRAGKIVESEEAWQTARELVRGMRQGLTEEQQQQKKIKELERNLIGQKIPGFWATPTSVVDSLVEQADIEPGHDVLEPSAGAGSIIEGIGRAVEGVKVDAVEFNYQLREMLEAKGYKPLAADFLEYAPGKKYDRIVMNPPFENGADMDHVRHAYDLLKPGGRLVSIMGEGAFFRSDQKATNFRDWLEVVNGYSEQMDDGAFNTAEGTFRTTGTNTRTVVIDKPTAAEDAQDAAPVLAPEPALAEIPMAAYQFGDGQATVRIAPQGDTPFVRVLYADKTRNVSVTKGFQPDTWTQAYAQAIAYLKRATAGDRPASLAVEDFQAKAEEHFDRDELRGEMGLSLDDQPWKDAEDGTPVPKASTADTDVELATYAQSVEDGKPSMKLDEAWQMLVDSGRADAKVMSQPRGHVNMAQLIEVQNAEETAGPVVKGVITAEHLRDPDLAAKAGASILSKIPTEYARNVFLAGLSTPEGRAVALVLANRLPYLQALKANPSSTQDLEAVSKNPLTQPTVVVEFEYGATIDTVGQALEVGMNKQTFGKIVNIRPVPADLDIGESEGENRGFWAMNKNHPSVVKYQTRNEYKLQLGGNRAVQTATAESKGKFLDRVKSADTDPSSYLNNGLEDKTIREHILDTLGLTPEAFWQNVRNGNIEHVKEIAYVSKKREQWTRQGRWMFQPVDPQGDMFEAPSPVGAEPEAEPAPEAKPKAKPPEERIDDLGEKIGGARKDESDGRTRKKAKNAEGSKVPAWRKEYEVWEEVRGGGRIAAFAPISLSDIAEGKTPERAGEKTGKFEIVRHRKKGSVMSTMPQKIKGGFDTREEAELFIPIAHVGLKHRVHPEKDGTWTVVRRVTDRKRAEIKGGFDSKEAAMIYMIGHAEEIIAWRPTKPIRPHLTDLQRQGMPEVRKGDVSPDEFMAAFGFRGVEFGNWLPQDERQLALNLSYDGLMDMADVLGVPPRALSLNGELAVGFGSRGRGSAGGRDAAAAHYEPQKVVINLTRIRGAGSMAHEWFHAFDHYLARQDGGKLDSRKRSKARFMDDANVSHGFSYKSQVREELRERFGRVMDVIRRTEGTFESDPQQYAKRTEHSLKELAQSVDALVSGLGETLDRKYWKRNYKPASEEQLAEARRLGEKIKALDVGEDEALAGTGGKGPAARRWGPPEVQALSDIFKAVRGRTGWRERDVIDGLNGRVRFTQMARETEERERGVTEKTRKINTNYFTEARRLDGSTSGDYYSLKHELVARAFEAFMFDAIAARGAASQYLVHSVENKYYMPFGKPYPEGEERDAINQAFTELFEVVEASAPDDNGNVSLYSLRETPGQGLERRRIEKMIAPVREAFAGALNIRVVSSPDELPGDGHPALVEGVYFSGTNDVWVVASNLHTPERVAEILRHEAVGHAAMERLPEFGRIIQRVKATVASGMDQQINKLSAEVAQRQPNLDTETHAKEVIALLAERGGSKQSWWKRLQQRFRQWMHRMGFRGRMGVDELNGWIARAFSEAQKDAAFMRDRSPASAAAYVFSKEFGGGMDALLDRLGSHRLDEAHGRVMHAAQERPGPVYQTMFHGTDAKFDEFSSEYIGTGEGAQAYGHGLYFAESPGVANNYRRQLSSMIPGYKGQRLAEAFNTQRATPVVAAIKRLHHVVYMNLEDFDQAVEWQYAESLKKIRRAESDLKEVATLTEKDGYTEAEKREIAKNIRAELPGLRELARVFKTIKESDLTPIPGGHMYEVEIADGAIDRMLDWDAPLSEQPALRVVNPELFDQITRGQDHNPKFPENFTGGKFYDALASDLGQPGASDLLREYGIPGIRYFDGQSRDGGRIRREVMAALKRNDNAGFGSPQEALSAFRTHPDWATRWDILPDDVATIQKQIDLGPLRTRNIVVFPGEEQNVITHMKRDGQPLYQVAWHGTHADFWELDLSKVGTGEGVQVYGWGLYLGERKSTGRFYQDSVGNKGSFRPYMMDGELLTGREAVERMTTELRAQGIDYPGLRFNVQALMGSHNFTNGYGLNDGAIKSTFGESHSRYMEQGGDRAGGAAAWIHRYGSKDAALAAARKSQEEEFEGNPIFEQIIEALEAFTPWPENYEQIIEDALDRVWYTGQTPDARFGIVPGNTSWRRKDLRGSAYKLFKSITYKSGDADNAELRLLNAATGARQDAEYLLGVKAGQGDAKEPWDVWDHAAYKKLEPHVQFDVQTARRTLMIFHDMQPKVERIEGGYLYRAEIADDAAKRLLHYNLPLADQEELLEALNPRVVDDNTIELGGVPIPVENLPADENEILELGTYVHHARDAVEHAMGQWLQDIDPTNVTVGTDDLAGGRQHLGKTVSVEAASNRFPLAEQLLETLQERTDYLETGWDEREITAPVYRAHLGALAAIDDLMASPARWDRLNEQGVALLKAASESDSFGANDLVNYVNFARNSPEVAEIMLTLEPMVAARLQNDVDSMDHLTSESPAQARLQALLKLTGNEWYADIEERLGNDSKAASEYLRELGIPGLKFWDGYTRHKDGDKTHNFVIWDEGVVDVQTRQLGHTGAVEFKPITAEELARPLYSVAASAQMPADLQSIRDSVIAKNSSDMTFRDKMREVVTRVKSVQGASVRQGMLDSFHSWKLLEEEQFGQVLDAQHSAYKAALATRNLPSVVAAWLKAGSPELRDGTFSPVAGRKGLLEILKAVVEHADGNLIEQWELYAVARRADRLLGETNPDGTQREKLMTREQVDRVLAHAAQYPEFEAAFNDYQQMNKELLDMAEAVGVIDGEARAVWEQNDYVPFYRAMSDMEDGQASGPKARRGLSGQDANPRRLWGGEEKLNSPVENMVMNASYLLDQSFRAVAMQRLVGLGEGVVLERVPMKMKAFSFTNDQLARALVKAGLVVGQEAQPFGPARQALARTKALHKQAILAVERMTPEQRAGWSKVFGRVAPVGADIVSVMHNGKPEYFRVTDPLVLRSILELRPEAFDGIMGLFRGAKKLLTGAVTATPGFMGANFIRDTLSTWVVTGHDTHPFVHAIKGMKQSFTEDETLVKMMMAGAGGGGYYDSNPEDIRKLLREKMPASKVESHLAKVVTPKTWWKAWRRIGAATENANRVAVYDATIAAGGTEAEAAYQARDVLNFSMSGDYRAVQVIIQMVPFLNARLQGLYRLARGGQEHKKKFVMRGLTLMAATLALLLKNRDDERYKELEEWKKDIYWHAWVGDQHIMIPKPFEVGAIFAMLPERMAQLSTGEDDFALFADRMTRMVLDTFAFNPTPQLVKPVVEQYANRSMFTGRPIVGMADSRLQPEEQWSPWTSETMRALAEGVPDWAPKWARSPKRLESFLRGYTGTLGIYALNMVDNATRWAGDYPETPETRYTDLPLLRRFLGSKTPRNTKYATKLYELVDEANGLFSTVNRLRRRQEFGEAAELVEDNRGALQARGKLNAIVEQMRALNRQVERVYMDRDLTPAEKRDRLDTIQARKNEVLRRVQDVEHLF